MALTAPCFKCGITLSPSIPEKFNSPHNQPSGGTSFSASGNYGSGIWDPVGDHRVHLEINICDECMLAHKERVLSVMVIQHQEVTSEQWEPETE